jgi:amidohydrolase
MNMQVHKQIICMASVLALWADPGVAHGQTGTQVSNQIDRESVELVEFYKDLHRTPELSLQEEKTAGKVADHLEKAGFSVTRRVGGHGIVGIFRNGNGPTVLVRTDLDALPVTEETALPYASGQRGTNEVGEAVGIMHACGHDIHMTVFVGTARLLAKLKDDWHGTVIFIGQPAEERGKGARNMLNDGLFTRFPKPDYCLALHVHAAMAAGKVGYVVGYAMANVDSVDLTIRGIGGHGAWPHATKDPIVLAAQTVLALQTIVSREVPPIEPAVVTVGSIHGGTKHNIIPDEVKLQLSLRSYNDQVRTQLVASIKRISRGLAEAAGMPESRYPTVALKDEFTPATYNDPVLTQRLAKVFRTAIGDQNVSEEKPAMGGEDFGEYGRTADKIPVCLFWLGAVDPEVIRASKEQGTQLPSLHSSKFRPLPEPTIKTGIKAMFSAVTELAGQKQ